jgi:hypothetical protein
MKQPHKQVSHRITAVVSKPVEGKSVIALNLTTRVEETREFHLPDPTQANLVRWIAALLRSFRDPARKASLLTEAGLGELACCQEKGLSLLCTQLARRANSYAPCADLDALEDMAYAVHSSITEGSVPPPGTYERLDGIVSAALARYCPA